MISAALLIAAGRQARDHGGKLPEHLRPTELGTPKCLIAPRLGDVEARVLKEDTRPLAVRLEPEAYPRTNESTGRPREHEPTGRFALEYLAAHDQPVETGLGVG